MDNKIYPDGPPEFTKYLEPFAKQEDVIKNVDPYSEHGKPGAWLPVTSGYLQVVEDKSDWERGWDSGKQFVQGGVRAILDEVTRYNNSREWKDEDPVQREISSREMWRRIKEICKNVGVS